ncbi:efflux RND transporter periplasmic adaptor subunit, partial [Runella sp. S5]|nr:efflux RND transporter periplasmic adaptor subunit [Runella salmonicolor]
VKNTIAVPTNALIQDTNGVTVWLENAEGAFESRMVSVGMTNKDYTEITDGLKAGEKVVISGAYLLNSEYIFKKGSNPMEGHKM